MTLYVRLKMPWWAGLYIRFLRIKILLGFRFDLVSSSQFLARHIRKEVVK